MYYYSKRFQVRVRVTPSASVAERSSGPSRQYTLVCTPRRVPGADPSGPARHVVTRHAGTYSAWLVHSAFSYHSV